MHFLVVGVVVILLVTTAANIRVLGSVLKYSKTSFHTLLLTLLKYGHLSITNSLLGSEETSPVNFTFVIRTPP